MRRRNARFVGWVVLGILGIGLASEAHGQTFCSSQFDLVNTHLAPLPWVGLSVVTLKLGEKPCFFVGGEIEKGSGVTPDPNTIFELASVTKVFTTAILAMRERQGLEVTSPVKPHLPPSYALLSGEREVTFQQLATFTGGFWWDDPPGFANGDQYSQDDFVDDVNLLVPQDPIPGVGASDLPTFFHYSNGSTGLLGQALMHRDSPSTYPLNATGFSNWISDNLTGPLNMPNTAVNPGGKWAKGYNSKNSQKHVQPFPWEPWGAAGALRSNTADMVNFLAANICAHHVSDPACTGFPKDVLTALATAHRPNEYTPSGSLADRTIYAGACGGRNEQAYAWVYLVPPDPNPNHYTPIIWKDGGHPGFSTFIGFSPDRSYGLVILLNTGGIGLINAGEKMIELTP